MADSTSSRLQRLQLSAVDLKNITAEIKPGEPWPDALVEDYLNILRDLFTLAAEIDANAGEVFRRLDEDDQEIASNRAAIAKITAIVGSVFTRIDAQDLRINDLEQLIYAW